MIRKTQFSIFTKIVTPFHNNRGATAVEVALTMLPFFIAIFSVIEFGWFYLHQHTLNAATSQGIRIGATGQSLLDGDGNTQSREDSIRQAIRDRAADVMEIDPSDIQIFPIKADFTDADDPAVANAGGAGAFMRVRVTYNHRFFTGLIGHFFTDSGSLAMSAEGTFRNEDFIL